MIEDPAIREQEYAISYMCEGKEYQRQKRKLMRKSLLHWKKRYKNDFVDNFLADKPVVSHKMIASKPMIGMINGMYASSNYLGGITIIQVMKVLSERKLSFL